MEKKYDWGKIGLILCIVYALLMGIYLEYDLRNLRIDYGLVIGRIIEIDHEYQAQYMYKIDGKTYYGNQGVNSRNDRGALYIIAFGSRDYDQNYLVMKDSLNYSYGDRLDSLKGKIDIDFSFWEYTL